VAKRCELGLPFGFGFGFGLQDGYLVMWILYYLKN
jgi:hypothetical protein